MTKNQTPEPTAKALRVDHLTVDPTVQRTLDPRRVDKIAEEFKVAALGTFVVSLRGDGTYHVIDGQTRRAACIAVDKNKLMVNCLVYEGLTKAEEALMFRLLNNRRGVSSLDGFRLRIVEGDPVARKLNNLLALNAWHLSGAKTRGAFAAVGALEKVYVKAEAAERGTEVIDGALKILTIAFEGDPDSVRAEVISGLGMLMAANQTGLDTPKLIRELGTYPGGARGLIGAAKGLRGMKGGRIGDAMAEVLTELHNKRKTGRRLPDWSRR